MLIDKSLYILRHGQTQFNQQGRLQGHCDSPLTTLGQAQAQAFGQTLKQHLLQTHSEISDWTLIASPLGRALQTAHIVADNLGIACSEIQTDKRVIETGLGDWEQQKIQDIKTRHPHLHNLGGWYFQAPNVERLACVRHRLQNWLDDPATPARVILVSHGLTGVILRGLLDNLDDSSLWQLDKPQDAFYYFNQGQLSRLSASTYL